MPRCKILGWTLLALVFMTFLSAGAILAEETTAPQTAPPAPSSLSFANCGRSLDLNNSLKGEICPATQPEPEFMAKPPRVRYCSCGCGATCTTDADCDGGVCINVITCC